MAPASKGTLLNIHYYYYYYYLSIYLSNYLKEIIIMRPQLKQVFSLVKFSLNHYKHYIYYIYIIQIVHENCYIDM